MLLPGVVGDEGEPGMSVREAVTGHKRGRVARHHESAVSTYSQIERLDGMLSTVHEVLGDGMRGLRARLAVLVAERDELRRFVEGVKPLMTDLMVAHSMTDVEVEIVDESAVYCAICQTNELRPGTAETWVSECGHAMCMSCAGNAHVSRTSEANSPLVQCPFCCAAKARFKIYL